MGRQAQMERNPSFSMQNGIQRPNAMNVSPPAQQNAPTYPDMAFLHLVQLNFEIDLVYYSLFYEQMSFFFFSMSRPFWNKVL